MSDSLLLSSLSTAVAKLALQPFVLSNGACLGIGAWSSKSHGGWRCSRSRCHLNLHFAVQFLVTDTWMRYVYICKAHSWNIQFITLTEVGLDKSGKKFIDICLLALRAWHRALAASHQSYKSTDHEDCRYSH